MASNTTSGAPDAPEDLSKLIDMIEYPYAHLSDEDDRLPYSPRKKAARAIQENALQEWRASTTKDIADRLDTLEKKIETAETELIKEVRLDELRELHASPNITDGDKDALYENYTKHRIATINASEVQKNG